MLQGSFDNTMSVGQLREFLARFPESTPVIAEWEGTWNRINADEHIDWTLRDGVLVFDVDDRDKRAPQIESLPRR